ncbi:3-oxoacyl-[acyl-carrier-protein] synthase III C-terminal domain-containing protein [Amycolatopsis coloradensis]|uniref:3-oxoacyl-[acyl-carrier-protein] synthase III C-terminal domain-containing protein n=1 Tax=Amycolatopsis coloradensis TaxID=76021 RepID=UPI001FCA21C2|nr:3-oxoacyl-[acyl-carrier-protein] synthase III C-terminal domain-containing protein [Amycolatopsis coloradensis]
MFRKIYGLDTLRYDPEMSLFDLILPAARRALAAVPEGGRVSHLIYAHTMPTVTPAHIDAAQVVRERLDLRDAEAFALTQQACVSSLGAVDVAARLLRAEGTENGYALVVTGEQAFSPAVQLIPNSAIMADAAAACLVGIDGRGDVVRAFVSSTLGEFAEGLRMTRAEIQSFGQVYAKELAEIIRRAVDEAGLAPDDIDLVLPHNVNAVSWRQAIKELDWPSERFFLDNIARLSHCYSADVFVNYTTVRAAARLVDGRHYLLVSVGLGATFGAMVITHRAR